MRTIPYGQHWIDESDIDVVSEILRGKWITQGPTVEKFEKKIAEYVDVKYAIVFNSGTAALHAAMFAAGVTESSSIITSPISFVASSNAAIYLGAQPQFVDIDIRNYCMDLEKITSNFRQSEKCNVVVPVDYAGYPVNIHNLRELTKSIEDLIIIEDAAHALGAKRNGKIVGQEADMTMFSFHPVKHITTGEGGVIVTNNETFRERMNNFRTHGITKDRKKFKRKTNEPWYYEMINLGYNYRITDLQCALGLSQLTKLKSFINRRNRIAESYYSAFKDLDEIILPPLPQYPNSVHAFHIYPLRIKDTKKKLLLYNYLKDNKIVCQVHYIPIHLQPFYQENYNFKSGDFPIAESFYQQELTIPLYPKMTNEDTEHVIERILDFFAS